MPARHIHGSRLRAVALCSRPTTTRVLSAALLLASLALAPAARASPPESDEAIRVIVNDWTSQIVLANIASTLFQRMGYSTVLSPAETAEQWGALSLGLEHVQVEVWEGTMATMYERMVEHGGIVEVGVHDATTREEWWYPSYVEEQCPGLPDWRALQRCSAIFATERSAPQGRYLGGPWEKPDEARIRALELDFIVTRVKNAVDLWLGLEQAAAQRQPIVLFNWSPNWVEARYEGKFIEFPEHDAQCETDPAWGPNPEFTHDCGNPRSGWLKKAAWHGMEQTWPCAFRALERVNFSNAMIAELAAWVEVDGLSPEQAATRWITTNEARFSAWIPLECRESVQ